MRISHVPSAYQISQMIQIDEQKRILEYLKKQLDRDITVEKNKEIEKPEDSHRK